MRWAAVERGQKTEPKRLRDVALLEQRLGQALQLVEDGLAMFDADDRLCWCNAAFRRLLGAVVPSEALAGHRYESLLEMWLRQLDFSDEAERIAFRLERLRRRSDTAADFDVRTREGRTIRVTERRGPERDAVLIGS